MTQEDFITNSTNFIEENLFQIKDKYFKNYSECKQAILIIEGDIIYISEHENSKLYNTLNEIQKSKIKELPDYEFLIIFADAGGYFSYFTLPSTNYNFENLSFLKLEGEIDEASVQIEYHKFIFVGDKELNIDKLNIKEVHFNYNEDDEDDEDFVKTLNNIIYSLQVRIKNGEISNEKLYIEILIFCYSMFNKITKSKDGYFEVIGENMYRNFNEIEKKNFIFILDLVIEIVQNLAEEVLSDNDFDNFNLDGINMSKLIGQAEGLKFDENIKGFDHLIGKMY